jgi:hypothetical protein
VRPRERVGRGVSTRIGRVSHLGLDDDRVSEEGSGLGDLGELAGELAVGQVQRPFADQSGGGGVPEGRRTPVAEGDLIAVGGHEELGEPVPNPLDKILHRRSAM